MNGWWSTRTRRERGMLALLGAVAAGVAFWGALEGLTGWRQAAERRMTQAANDHALTLAGAAIARSVRDQAPGGDVEAQALHAAEANGLEAIITDRAKGGVTVNFESATSAAAFAWLAGMEAQGIRVSGFTALKNAEGALQISADLAAPA